MGFHMLFGLTFLYPVTQKYPCTILIHHAWNSSKTKLRHSHRRNELHELFNDIRNRYLEELLDEIDGEGS
jgi:hypothetical protein